MHDQQEGLGVSWRQIHISSSCMIFAPITNLKTSVGLTSILFYLKNIVSETLMSQYILRETTKVEGNQHEVTEE